MVSSADEELLEPVHAMVSVVGVRVGHQAFDVLGEDVDLEVDGVANSLVPKRGEGERGGDERDGERVVVDGGDGEAHAVDGDRALLDDVAGQRRREGEAARPPSGRRACARGSSAVPSTWPWTMCPPKRLLAAIARSRLTRSPGARAPRLLRASVSAITSTVNCPSPCSTTVRQTPLTAMEAPWVASLRHERPGHGEPGRVRAGVEPDHVAELLDDSGEHQADLLQACGDPHVVADQR